MAFYTNPGWSNLTPPPVSEQNLNDMSNALENAAYVENGKLYDNNNNLVDIANAKITLGSYVGNGTNQITIQIPENQCFFVMLSDVNGEPGNCINIEYTGHTYTPWAVRGFVEQIGYASNQGAVYYVYDNGTYMAYIQRYSNAQNGELVFDIGKSYTGIQSYYNISGKTYHYATIGV